jgi:hypothetical protein
LSSSEEIALKFKKWYRFYYYKQKYLKQEEDFKKAAIIVQSHVRCSLCKTRTKTISQAIIIIQASTRGYLHRRNNPFVKKEKEQQEQQEQCSMKELQIPDMSSSSIVQYCNELYTYINQENWAMVETLLDKHPQVANIVEPTTGELPLHMIAQHASVWNVLVDMLLVLFPKALIHRDSQGALPIHHAAAHDN